MKFKIDENLPTDLAEFLNNEGYDAITVLDQNLGGTSDSAITKVCQTEQRILITLDTDFADIRAYRPEEYPGIMVLRIKKQDKFTILKLFERIVRLFPNEAVAGQLWIIEESRVRIRS